MNDYPDRISLTVYPQSASLIDAMRDAEKSVMEEYPGVQKTHEITNISGQGGASLFDHGFALDITLTRSQILNDETRETLKLADNT